jgi:pyruvate/2-oxoglutarate dehydrogenase complex dihydrolipoamide acyltransferase (E2) component
MELVAFLRILWVRRILVGVGILVAVGAGVLVGRKAEARTAASGASVSTLALMLDTTNSQLVGAAPFGASTLPTRAVLLADAVTADAATRTVARRAGVAVKDIAVSGPAARRLPPVDSPLVSQVYRIASGWTAPYTVNVLADAMTPIVKVEAVAPDAAHAARLARAAGSTLRSTLVRDDGHRSHGFVLDTVSPLTTKALPVKSSHKSLIMAAGTIATFLLWCAGVVLVAGLLRRLADLLRPRPA